ncbi:hypothetical protein O6H91_13G062100 [Diphasiastrum complanatum]|uniref:Uncharacterized protein n=1 Tax=Diphasiastrum complanatum TaxID=34168 RepID=A0ACC2BVE0_DIPCM|nr:hypothetical protein O6H91_13G062100 [Diphasiastrum complanatum]
MVRTHSDPNLYVLCFDGMVALIALYVDDLIITKNNQEMIDMIKKDLMEQFEMTDLSLMHYYLGVEVWQKGHEVSLTQVKYVKELLHRFRLQDCKPVNTPIEPGKRLSKLDESQSFDATMYRQLVGSLIYLTTTRPDICYVVGIVSQFMAAPTETHWKTAKRILHYVKGTSEYGVIYRKHDGLSELCGYVDANWGGDYDDCRFTTGYVFQFCGSCFFWSSKKQSTIALSTTEAEYKAMFSAAQEAIWLRQILEEIGMRQKNPTTLHSDNQSEIQLAKNLVFHARTKHIEIQYHFIRERLLSREIRVVHCSTEEQLADIFTKPLTGEKFDKFRSKLSVRKVC